MTTPPKVRRFHLSAAESPVAAVRGSAAPAPSQPPAGTPPRAAIRVELQRGARSGAEAAANLPLPGAAQPGGICLLYTSPSPRD